VKLCISADMAGTAAVSAWSQVDPGNTTEYPYYRRLMSREVRAAIDAAREAGVERARELIRAGAITAIEHVSQAKPFVFEPPIELDVDFVATHNADFAELIPGFERTGGRSVRFVHDDFRTLFKAYVAAFRLGASANAPV
jgi:D-aminopeptidase